MTDRANQNVCPVIRDNRTGIKICLNLKKLNLLCCQREIGEWHDVLVSSHFPNMLIHYINYFAPLKNNVKGEPLTILMFDVVILIQREITIDLGHVLLACMYVKTCFIGAVTKLNEYKRCRVLIGNKPLMRFFFFFFFFFSNLHLFS